MKFFIPLLLIFLPCHTFALEEKVDTLRMYEIDEVTVTASRWNRTPEVIPSQSMSGIQLQKLSSHSVADAIRFFSGAQIKDYGGIGGLKTVNIRSMGSSHVGVFYDGIELNNAQNGTIDLGRFSLDNMEAVTLYNGQKSAIFQPAKDYASSSSIYLQSKTPVFTDHKKYTVNATFKTGSFGLANPALYWEQKISPKVNLSVSTEYMYTTGRYKFRYKMYGQDKELKYDTTATRKNGDVNAFRAETGFFGKITNGFWRAKAYLYTSERGYPAAIVKNKFGNVDRQWDTDFFVQSTFSKIFGSRYEFMLNGKYAYNYTHFLTDARKDSAFMYMESRYRQQEAYLSVANKVTIFPWWNLNLSADFQYNTLWSDNTNFPFPTRYATYVALATSLQFEQFKFQASLLGIFIQDHTRYDIYQMAGNKNNYIPTLIASYRPWKETDFNIRAFYKKAFRMPTFNDLYYGMAGASRLKPETTAQYNLGLTYSKNFTHSWLDHIELQADGYYNVVDDKIISIPSHSFLKWSIMNLGKVKIKGLDAAIQTVWSFGKEWKLNGKVNYTYQQALDVTDPTKNYYKGQIPYIPLHSGSLILNGSYKAWEANYSFIYTGERYSNQTNTAEYYILPWYTSDFSVAYNFRWNSTRWRATVEVNNLFNQQYEVVNNYPMPGTNFRIILNIKL